MSTEYHKVRTPYVRILAAALKFAATQLLPFYGERWRITIDGSPADGFNLRFVHWDEAGLESAESFGISRGSYH